MVSHAATKTIANEIRYIIPVIITQTPPFTRVLKQPPPFLYSQCFSIIQKRKQAFSTCFLFIIYSVICSFRDCRFSQEYSQRSHRKYPPEPTEYANFKLSSAALPRPREQETHREQAGSCCGILTACQSDPRYTAQCSSHADPFLVALQKHPECFLLT